MLHFSFPGHNEETGEIERLMGNVAMPERRWTCPAESEDWDVGK